MSKKLVEEDNEKKWKIWRLKPSNQKGFWFELCLSQVKSYIYIYMKANERKCKHVHHLQTNKFSN